MSSSSQRVSVLEIWGGRLARASSAINGKLFVLSALALGIMALPTFLDVVSRLLFSRSLLGAVELVEFLMVLVVFASFGFLQDQRAHIKVDLIFERLPEPVRDTLSVFINGVGTVLFGLMAWCMWDSAMERAANGEVSMMLAIPVWWFAVFAVFGVACFCFALFASFVQALGEALTRRHGSALILGLILLGLAVWSPFPLRNMEWTQNYLVLGAVGMAVLLALLLLGMPIGVGMAAIGYGGLLVLYPEMASANAMLGLTPYTTGSNYVYTVVPMFILMGELAMYSGISSDLFQAANVWLGRLPGGLAVATVSGCAGFAAVSGDSMATAVTMASVALPEMTQKNTTLAWHALLWPRGAPWVSSYPPAPALFFIRW